ncbi:MAG: calcium-binding protein [Verrucomicrobiales bacterium]|nr:calcium-binding protein [Verrucomicrobiales bacterium]
MAGATIPGLGISVSDALTIVDVFCDLVHDFEDTIDGGLDGLEAYLNGILPGNVTVAFDYIGATLTFSLNLSDEVTESFAFNLGFDSFDDPALEAIGGFIDISTSGDLELIAGYDITLATAIDLTTAASPQFFILPATVASVYASVRADGTLSADVAVPGITSLSIKNGTFIFDADGLAATLDDPANFTVDFDFGGASQLSVSQLIPNITVDLDAQLTIDLPVCDGATPLDPAQPNLIITVGDLGDLLTGGGLPQIDVTSPNFADLLASGLDISGLYDGFVLFIELLRDTLDGEIFGINLPFIGNQFSGAVEFLDDLIALLPEDIFGAFADIANLLEIAFGDILTGPVTWSSIDPNEEVIFDFPLGGSWGADADLDFDLGVPALGLDVDGSPGFELAWSLDISIGIARGDGFFLVTDAALPELSLSFDADLDGFDANGTLGFLGVRVYDNPDDPSHFTAGVSVDILDPGTARADGRLILSEIAGANSAPLGAIISPEWGADASGNAISAEINLIIETFFDVPDTSIADFFPSLATDLYITWDFSPAALAGGDLSDLLPSVELRDIRLDLESYFDGFIGKILRDVRDALAPFDQLLAIIDTRLPVLSDFAALRDKWDSNGDGRVTILEVAPVSEATKKFLNTVVLINDLAGSIPDGTGTVTLIESYSLDGETLDDSSFDISTFDVDTGIFAPLNDVIGAVNGLVDDAEEFIASLGLEGPEPKETVKIDFPVFTNPLLAVNLLFGQNVDLFVLDLPVYDLSASFKASFPIFPVFPALQVSIGGTAGLTADIDFGYDTEGARRFANSNNPSDLLAGFFIYDHADRGAGKDKPEFILHAGIEASLDLNVLVASASVGGGLYATIEFDLDDLDDDGRFRGDEFAELFPDCLFQTHGEFTAGLFASLRAGLIKKRFDLATITIAEFDHECARVNPDLAHIEPDGTLFLHVGSNSNLRNFEPSETDETYIISRIQLDDGSFTTQIQFGTATETFDGYNAISGDFGSGNDTLTVMPDITVPLYASGGAGNDSLIAGGGAAELHGNGGDDSLAGSPFSDDIFGGDGNDLLTGGDGNDLLAGGEGDDVLLGGTGNDDLFGEAGDDDLTGDDGADLLEGGSGNDSIDGGSGNDNLFGDDGDDTLFGDQGIDHLEGGIGNDALLGGQGPDTLLGGDGDDILYGNSDSEASAAFQVFDLSSDFRRGLGRRTAKRPDQQSARYQP